MQLIRHKLGSDWFHCKFESRHEVTRGENYISSERFRRRNLLGETRGIQSQRRFSMLDEKESSWNKEGITSMV